jgi:hypothetical protein
LRQSAASSDAASNALRSCSLNDRMIFCLLSMPGRSKGLSDVLKLPENLSDLLAFDPDMPVPVANQIRPY